MSVEDVLRDLHICPGDNICPRCFEDWQRGGLEVVGENARTRKPRLNSPVRIARDAGYCGA